MYKALFCMLVVAFSSLVNANQLQGYGAFTDLNKDWMLVALYGQNAMKDSAADLQLSSSHSSDVAILPTRLEIKIATEKFTQRRFRALWLEAMAVEHGTEGMQQLNESLESFFSALKGPLIRGDMLVLELENGQTQVSLNYQTLTKLPASFLHKLVASMVGKHPPSKALREGLTGGSSAREQGDLAIRFERLEPTLPRIAQVSRWKPRHVKRLASQEAL